ncbi:MAG: hypothetical protein IJK93_09460 [Muribaculaceae bacterium]|nr:hypothetical protein [Muribaculaceae bacterium]
MKGKTNNPNGRPKGVPNKVTKTVREWITDFINDNRAQLEKDIKKLTPYERIRVIERFLPYIIPKQQAISARVDFSKLSEQQLDDIIRELLKGDEL